MENFTAKLAGWMYNKRVVLFILSIVAVLWAPLGFKKLHMEVSNESYFIEGDSTLINYNEFKEVFQTDEFVYLLYKTENIFNVEELSLLEDLTHDLEQVSHVNEVTSLINAPFVKTTADGIEVIDLIEKKPENKQQLDSLKQFCTNHHFYKNRLVSEDGKQVGVFVRTDIIKEDPNFRVKIRDEIYSIIGSDKYAHLGIRAAGAPINMPTYSQMIKKEMGKSLAITLILNLILLFILFKRRLAPMLTTLLIIIFSIAFTFALNGITGIPMTLLTTMLTVLLVCVGVGDSVHLMSAYQQELYKLKNKKEAYIKAVSHTFYPCLLTSITTACAFLALLVSKVAPVKYFGVFAAVGTIIAFIFTFTISALLISGIRIPKKIAMKGSEESTEDIWDKLLSLISRFTQKNPIPVVVGALVIAIISIIGIGKMKVESDFVKSFNPKHRIRQDIEFIDDNMGGSMSFEVVIDTKKENGIKDYNLLQSIEDLEKVFVEKYPDIHNSFSVVNLVKEVNKVLNENNEEYFNIPENRNAIAQLLLLYEMNDPDRLDDVVDFDYSKARVTFRTKMMSSTERENLQKDISKYLSENFDSSSKHIITGAAPMMTQMKSYLSKTQINSFGIAFIVISILMAFVFKSIRIGFLSMIPNIVPIFFVIGIAGLLGISLDVSTILVAAIAIGLIVDDTIHFIFRYKKIYGETGDYQTTVQKTLSGTGRGILFTSIALTISFSAYLTSEFLIVKQFGALIILTVILAVIADFILLPAVIKIFKPFRKK